MNIIPHPKQTSYWQRGRWLWLMPLLLTGFWLRLTFLVGNVYYTDEFISMLAAKLVAQQGLPIFPSGLFYDHGLLYSILGGGFVALLGFSEQVARWPVFLVGVFTIALYYAMARRLFDSHLTGILVAALVTFDTFAMKWGVWARMYAFAHMFVLLSMAWLLLSTLKRPNQRGRYLFLACLAGALFSHSLTFLMLPPLALLLLIFTLAYRRDWLRSPGLWWQGLLGGVIVIAALVVVAQGHVGSTISLQDRGDTATTLPTTLNFLQGFFLPTFDWDNSTSLFKFFQTPAYNWLLWVIGFGLLVSLYHLLRRKATFADVAFLFITLLPLLIIFEMGTFLTEEWRQSRYMFFLTLPAFFLLSAESLSRLLRGAAEAVSIWKGMPLSRGQLELVSPLIVVLLVGAMWGPPTWKLASARATGDFDTAYDFVRENQQPGDRIMTEHPPAAYLYIEQMDYYANQVSAKVLGDSESGSPPLDRYTGSPLIDTVEALNTTLAAGNRIWLVVGDKHLLRYYEPLFRQQIFAQMDVAYQAGSKYVFISHAQPIPVSVQPSAALDGNFNNSIILAGYHFDPANIMPNGLTSLGLYWQPIGPFPTKPSKVFVQLRDGQGQTIAQADHFLYEQLLGGRQWDRLREEGEWLRDTADLHLPLPLSPENGPYRIYVGFYDPETFERLPLINDTSGESAVVIELPFMN